MLKDLPFTGVGLGGSSFPKYGLPSLGLLVCPTGGWDGPFHWPWKQLAVKLTVSVTASVMLVLCRFARESTFTIRDLFCSIRALI